MTTPAPLVLLTRPEAQSQRFAAELVRHVAAEVLVSPVMEIVQTGAACDISGARALIFTSENGVAARAEDLRGSGKTAYCVGDRTARSAEALGLAAISAQGDADALVALIMKDRPEGPLLHIRGAQTRGDIAARLVAKGLLAGDCVAYEQRPKAVSSAARACLMGDKLVILPLFSPRSAQLALKDIEAPRENLRIVAMSDAVAKTIEKAGFCVDSVAKTPDARAMIHAIQETYGRIGAA